MWHVGAIVIAQGTGPWMIKDQKAWTDGQARSVVLPVHQYPITSVEATFSGDLQDIGVGIWNSPGNFLTAQHEEVDTDEDRILPTYNGVDETDPPWSQVFSSTTNLLILRLEVNWGSGEVKYYTNGTYRMSGWLDANAREKLEGATHVHFRANGYMAENYGETYAEDLRVNGVLVDDFNRSDSPELGQATNGEVWALREDY